MPAKPEQLKEFADAWAELNEWPGNDQDQLDYITKYLQAFPYSENTKDYLSKFLAVLPPAAEEHKKDLLTRLSAPLKSEVEKFINSQPEKFNDMRDALALFNELKHPEAAARQEQVTALIAKKKAQPPNPDLEAIRTHQATRQESRAEKESELVRRGNMDAIRRLADRTKAEAESNQEQEKAKYDAVKNFYLVVGCIDKIKKGKISNKQNILQELEALITGYKPGSEEEFNKKCDAVFNREHITKQVKKASKKYDAAFQQGEFQAFLTTQNTLKYDAMKAQVKAVTKTPTASDKLGKHVQSFLNAFKASHKSSQNQTKQGKSHSNDHQHDASVRTPKKKT